MNYLRPAIIGLLALATCRTPNPRSGQHGCSLGPAAHPSPAAAITVDFTGDADARRRSHSP